MKTFAHRGTASKSYGFMSDTGTLHGDLSDAIDQDFDTSFYEEIGPTKDMVFTYTVNWTSYINVRKVVLKWTTYGDNSGGPPVNNSRLSTVELQDDAFGIDILSDIERHSLSARTDTVEGTWDNINGIECTFVVNTSAGGNGRVQIWELEVYGEFPIRLRNGANTIYIGKNTNDFIRYGIDGCVEELAVGNVGDDLETSIRFYDGSSIRVLAGLEE